MANKLIFYIINLFQLKIWLRMFWEIQATAKGAIAPQGSYRAAREFSAGYLAPSAKAAALAGGGIDRALNLRPCLGINPCAAPLPP
jgi:hypothetical protein